MATKDHFLPDKLNIDNGETSNNNQYSNLNLNHNYQSLHASENTVQSKRAIKNSRKNQNYEFTDSIYLKVKKNSSSWNKSNKHLSSNLLNNYQETEEHNEFNKSKSANNSTLSLHISAYEDSFESDATDSNGGEKRHSKRRNKKITLIEKQDFIGSSSYITNPFEFPRQQKEDQNKYPEVMQFKASQLLCNPNKENLNVNETSDALKILMNNIDMMFYCDENGEHNYDHYKSFRHPSEAVTKFMSLMLEEFPHVFEFICDRHENIHIMLKKEGVKCTIPSSFSKSAEFCKDIVDKAIEDCIKFCFIINKNHFVMPLLPPDLLREAIPFDKNRLCIYREFFKDFFEVLINKFDEMSLHNNPVIQKLLELYYEAMKRKAALPMFAAKNRIKLENQQHDLKKRLATITERNEKRVDRVGYLLKMHDKCISESENCKVKAESLHVQKKSVDDLMAKTAEKEADMEKMNKLLKVLKDQLLEVKKTGTKLQEARNTERSAKKALINELNSIVDERNSKIHQKEISLGTKRKASTAILKAEKERLQELDLTFLQLRFQNITTAIVDFVNHRKRELAHLNKLLPEAPAEQKKLLEENMKLLFFQINQEKEKLKRLESAYKQYIAQVRQGTILATLPPIDLSVPTANNNAATVSPIS